MADVAIVTKLVRQADQFADFAGAFAQLFGFDVDALEAVVSEWHEIVKTLGQAEAAKDPIDRIEWWLQLSGWRRWGDSLLFRAIGQDEVRAVSKRVQAIGPEGKTPDRIAYDYYLDLGQKAMEGVPNPLPRHNEIGALLDDLQKQKTAITDAIFKKYEDDVKRIKAESGYQPLVDLKKEIRARYSEMRNALRGDLHGSEMTREEYAKRYDNLELEESQVVGGVIARLRPIDDMINQAQVDSVNEIQRATEHLSEQMDMLNREESDIINRFFSAVIDKILETSEISVEDAETWANSQPISPSAKNRLKKLNYPVEKVRRHMAEFYRAVNGRVPVVSLGSKRGNRADGAHWTGNVRIAGHFDKEVLWHEMGHLLEMHPRLLRLANNFLDTRTNRKNGEKPQRLSAITGNKYYEKDEVAHPDKFINPYIGKVYGKGYCTEVFSMGIQHFSKPIRALELYEKDPQMFQLMLGVMKAPKGQIEQELIGGRKHEKDVARKEDEKNKKFYNELAKKSADIEKLIAGSAFKIESYVRWWDAKPTSSFTVKYQDPATWKWTWWDTFRNEKDARMCLYLILGVLSSAGMEAVKNTRHAIAEAVSKKTAPPRFFGDPPEVLKVEETIIPKAAREATTNDR